MVQWTHEATLRTRVFVLTILIYSCTVSIIFISELAVFFRVTVVSGACGNGSRWKVVLGKAEFALCLDR